MRAYIASTPYHLLLSLTLQHRDGAPEAGLVFSDEADLFKRMPTLRAHMADQFRLRKVTKLQGRAVVFDPFRCRLATWGTVRALSELDADELFVFNGQTPPALSLGERRRRPQRFHYVEDGLDAYLPVNLRPVRRWHEELHRLAFGWPHPNLVDMTDALPYSTYHVLYPDLARARVPTECITRIPSDSFRWSVDRLQELVDWAPGEPAVSHLYMMDLHTWRRSVAKAVSAVRSWAQVIRALDPTAKPAVKTHPRDTNRRLVSALEGIEGLRVLPPWLPSELLAPALRPDVRIRCGLTTFIVTSRVLVPGRRIELGPTVAPEAADVLSRWDSAISVVAS